MAVSATFACVACGSMPTQSDRESAEQALARLEADTGSSWTLERAPRGVVRLEGRATTREAPREASLGLLRRYRGLLAVREPDREFRVVRDMTDDLATSHVRLAQEVSGVPVRGGEVDFHFDRDGALRSVDSAYMPAAASVKTTPTIDAARAVHIARAALESVHTRLTLDEEPAAALAIVMHESEARLVYEIECRAQSADALVSRRLWIDAHDGHVLRQFDLLQTVAGSGLGVVGDRKAPLQVTQANTTYQLVDATRSAAGIRTYTAAQAQTLPGTLITSNDVATWDAVSPGTGAGVDAHYFAGMVYDYYKTRHNRDGVDGRGAGITSTVHYGARYNNAFWDGRQMAYGDGDGTNFRAFSGAVDVIAHELTHAVTQFTSQLAYQDQSGALNEAVSDIFAAFVEHSVKPDAKNNVLIAEGIALGTAGTRDLAHPRNGNQPAHMNQFLQTTQDNGGVHTNSGIVNNAWYLMTLGGTNDVSGVRVAFGLGWDRSEKLWYRAMTTYFMTTTDFAGAARGTLSAARDLQLSANETNIVECGWIAVGVLPGTCKPIVEPAPASPPGSNTNAPGATTQETQSDQINPPDAKAETSKSSDAPTPATRSMRAPVETTGCSVSSGRDLYGSGLWPWLTLSLFFLSNARRRRTR